MAIPTVTQSSGSSILDLVGDTPLIRLRRIERDLQCAIDAKDCAAYAACKAANDDGDGGGDVPVPTLPR